MSYREHGLSQGACLTGSMAYHREHELCRVETTYRLSESGAIYEQCGNLSGRIQTSVFICVLYTRDIMTTRLTHS